MDNEKCKEMNIANDKGKTRARNDMRTEEPEGTEGNVGYSSDSTHYADNEDERMAVNSTDEE